MELEYKAHPTNCGKRIGIELSKRSIILKNEVMEKEVAPLVYIIWRKCNGSNSVEDILEYVVQRTKKSREFVENVVFEILEDLKATSFVIY
ncbi:MAG: PqqD family peptide modification chaperone [Candidatus Lokiarchaeota archaeon]|nr:PqqD family peptide modification chaperone [Candidatus Lokiarchaeota archaeon]